MKGRVKGEEEKGNLVGYEKKVEGNKVGYEKEEKGEFGGL